MNVCSQELNRKFCQYEATSVRVVYDEMTVNMVLVVGQLAEIWVYAADADELLANFLEFVYTFQL